MLGHVIFELVDPLALVSTLRAQVLSFLFMDPHVVLEDKTQNAYSPYNRVLPLRSQLFVTSYIVGSANP